MKLRFILIAVALIVVVVIAACVMPSGADAAPKKAAVKTARRSVLDYFRLLPNMSESGDRESLIGKNSPHLIDNGNDYMQVTGDGAQPSFQIAVFRYRGRDLVAVSSVIGGPDYFFDLWRYERKKWKNVTSSVALAENSSLHFVLPRRGTTIKVFRRNGTLAAQLLWKNGRFDVQGFDSMGHSTDGPA